MIFGVICVEVSRKFSKNPHFWQKSISTQDENFESISTEVPSSSKIALITIYSPTPEVINSCYIQSSLNYKPSDKTILETLTFAYEQKLEAFKHQIRTEDKQPYFQYAEK